VLQAFDELPDAVRYGLAFAVPFLVTLLATPVAARAAVRLGFVDLPAPHKTHVDPTPYLGGAALAAGLGVVGVVAVGGSVQIATILVAAIAIAVLGLVDDARGLQPPIKLGVEAAAAIALYVTGSGGGVFGIPALDLPLTIVWVVVVTNALNLLDNMDGLAPGVAAMSALAFFGISAYEMHFLVGSLAAALAGASLGFLPHNFPPARVFLGDAGSLLVGFLLAAIGLNLDLIGQSGVIRVAVPLLALAVPLFDTTLVVIARFRDRRPVFRGGTDHTSHRLAARGLTHVQVALLAIVAQAACSILAFAMYVSSDGTLLAGTIVVAALSAGGLLAMLRLEHPGAPAEVPSDDVVEIPEPADAVDTLGILDPQVNPLDG
jgi:UDP-GlcNAc:undecaprenyl-phosphate GlcNAc-1-phosphate transferase